MQTSNTGLGLIKNLKSAATIAYHASNGGLKLIEGQEGCRLVAYRDTAGVWTIGWGSTRYANGKPVKQGDNITRQQADELFLVTLKGFEADVNRMVKVPITQNQFDALLSWHYNTGGMTATTCTLRAKLNAGDYMGAADQFLVWNKITDPETKQKVPSITLTNRRKIERQLFIKDIQQAA